jgi:hypothetical protein
MVRFLKTFLPALTLATLLAGCGGPSTEETPGMRDAMTKPPKFDINNVPPQNRAIVEAMTSGRNKQSGAPPTTAPAPKTGGN